MSKFTYNLISCLCGVVTLVGLILIFAGLEKPILMVLGVIAIILAIIIARPISKKVNQNYYNTNNDGIYTHLYETPIERSEIILDVNKKTLFLRSNKREKTFSFNDIKSWTYEIYQAGETHAGFVGGSGINGLMGQLGAQAQADKINIKNRERALEASGFVITTKDFEQPIWHIKFGGRIADVEQQCQAWMNVFEHVFNNA
ncbi:DUF4755 domain-containing protein [Haemophilus haemoglobinophilus]|nr:DUF4755 domain-containing protein [Canicola haemoglobinophilus]